MKKRGGFIRTKCPKCSGAVYLDIDRYGWYERCLMCGYTADLERVAATEEKVGKIASRDETET